SGSTSESYGPLSGVANKAVAIRGRGLRRPCWEDSPSDWRSALMLCRLLSANSGAAVTEAGVPRTTTPQIDHYWDATVLPTGGHPPFSGRNEDPPNEGVSVDKGPR